ncbi:hypothetical protein YTPLAS18_21760 [Nitrospira sp.]|nr:hypothetical protein YTPLAS18_21760 [Nitrospira sp.]
MHQTLPQAAPPAATVPLVSIVICTKDRPRELVRAIESVRACGAMGRTAEIIVVEESDLPTAVTGVRHVSHRRQGGGFGQTRNAGVRFAHAPYIVFFDDDCEAEAGWLERLLAPLEQDATILGVAGSVLVHNCGTIGYAENILGFPGGGLRYVHEARGRTVPTQVLSTCNCAYRREAYLQAGGCPEDPLYRTPGGEDFVLAERIRRLGRCVYVPDAAVYHRPRGSLRSIARWFAGRGRNEILALLSTPDPKSFGAFLLRSSWTVRFVALVGVVFWQPSLIRWLPVCLVVYFAAMLWRYRFARAYASHRRAWWVVPLVKLTMDLGTEVGRWQGLTGLLRSTILPTPAGSPRI